MPGRFTHILFFPLMIQEEELRHSLLSEIIITTYMYEKEFGSKHGTVALFVIFKK